MSENLCSPRTETTEGDKTPASEELGFLYMRDILTDEQPDAVVATDDFLAFGALRALRENRQPDITVYGFNNSIRGRYQHPSLASVDIHPEQLGYHATRLLINCIQDRKGDPTHQIVDTSVIHRETSLKS